jgi:hypothetical protein
MRNLLIRQVVIHMIGRISPLKLLKSVVSVLTVWLWTTFSCLATDWMVNTQLNFYLCLKLKEILYNQIILESTRWCGRHFSIAVEVNWIAWINTSNSHRFVQRCLAGLGSFREHWTIGVEHNLFRSPTRWGSLQNLRVSGSPWFECELVCHRWRDILLKISVRANCLREW